MAWHGMGMASMDGPVHVLHMQCYVCMYVCTMYGYVCKPPCGRFRGPSTTCDTNLNQTEPGGGDFFFSFLKLLSLFCVPNIHGILCR